MSKNTWIIVDDGKTGTEVQCLGLTDQLGLQPHVFRVRLGYPHKVMPNGIQAGVLNAARIRPKLTSSRTRPEIIITAGRQSVGVALAARNKYAPTATLIAIQDPKVPSSQFDWVIAPEHDHVKGNNVIQTIGAMNRISRADIAAKAALQASNFETLPTHKTAVMIGGSIRGATLNARWAKDMMQKLASNTDGAILLSTSRRTTIDVMEAVKTAMAGVPGIQYYGVGDNPYHAFLHYADSIVVTSDSISMISEACSAQKPVYIAELPGKRGKFAAFIKKLYEKGLARRFTGHATPFEAPGLNESKRVADLLRPKLGLPTAQEDSSLAS